MKSTNRRAASAAGILALSLAAPLAAQQQQPQRGSPPNADTPYIIITTFRSNDRQLGVQMADELRKRVTQEHSAKELFVVQKNSINGTLEASGYRPDSALSSSDIMELAKGLRGEIATEGSIDKTAAGVHVDARILMKSGQAIVSQPLTPFDAKDVGDAAKQLEKAISESNKALGNYKTCKNSVVAAKYPEAAAAARAGLVAYPNSTFNRICLLGVLTQQKASPDEIITVASDLKRIDPTAMIARANLADAYLAKGDTTHAIEEQLAIYKIDPSNTALAQNIVTTLASSGAPDKALPIIDSLLVNNPGDPSMLRQKYYLQLRLGRLKEALVSGEEWVKADTSAANLDYFQRQIGAAQRDSNNAAVIQFATKAAAKFPKDPTFNLIVARANIASGQMQPGIAAARRASDADPKASSPWLMIISAFNQMNEKDSAVATAQKAIAAGVSRDTIGAQLLATAVPLIQKAQQSKSREDWKAALKAFEDVDAIASTPQSAFYIGVSAMSIAGDALSGLNDLAKSTKKDDKAKGCEEVKIVEDNFAIVQTMMPKGGRVDPATAGNMLKQVGEFSAYIPQFKKAFGCK